MVTAKGSSVKDGSVLGMWNIFVPIYQTHIMFLLSKCLLSIFFKMFVPSIKLLLSQFALLFQNISILYIKFQIK